MSRFTILAGLALIFLTLIAAALTGFAWVVGGEVQTMRPISVPVALPGEQR
jgi:hypothetical protein